MLTDSASGYRTAAIATLAVAVAGRTLLAGLFQLRWAPPLFSPARIVETACALVGITLAASISPARAATRVPLAQIHA